MTRDHSVIEELMAVDALGGLDGDDRGLLERERASHGTDCPDCTALEAGFVEIAGRLAFVIDPEPVDDAMVDRILGRGDASTATETIVEIPGAPDELEERRARRPRVWQALVAAAAVVAIAVVAVGAIVPSTTSVQATTSQRLVAFTGVTEGSLAMAFTPGEPGAVFWGGGLPDPGRIASTRSG